MPQHVLGMCLRLLENTTVRVCVSDSVCVSSELNECSYLWEYVCVGVICTFRDGLHLFGLTDRLI